MSIKLSKDFKYGVLIYGQCNIYNNIVNAKLNITYTS